MDDRKPLYNTGVHIMTSRMISNNSMIHQKCLGRMKCKELLNFWFFPVKKKTEGYFYQVKKK